MRSLLSASRGQDVVYIVLRTLILGGGFLALGLARSGLSSPMRFLLSDALLVLVVGGLGTAVLGLLLAINPIRQYLPVAIFPADLALVAVFSYATGQETWLAALFATTLIIMGISRLGSGWGLALASGAGVAWLGAEVANGNINLAYVQGIPPAIFASVLLYAVACLAAGVWANVRDDDNGIKRKRFRAQMEESLRRVEQMKLRLNSIAEMGASLNSTFNYDKILEATMDIGRLCLRGDLRQRLISMALIVEDAHSLVIGTSRGLQHMDMKHRFRGQQGILKAAIDKGEPVIIQQGGQHDPELGELLAFGGVESVLVIPLRANYATYGLLVYGSSDADAFSGDQIGSMQALGVQACIALQNAVLYQTVQDEKNRILAIEENARQALVRDLHDIPAQTTAGIIMQLDMARRTAKVNPDALDADLERIMELAKRANDEIRYVLFSLRPLALETGGLQAALGQLADKMQKTYQQAVKVQVVPEAEYYLTQEQQGALFYLIEEATNNARKYAQATLINISVRIENNAVVARVVDNGQGFDSAAVTQNYQARGSFGMVNMRERAELVGGKFDLRSQTGRGTQVTVIIPIDPKLLPKTNPKPDAERRRFDRPQTGPLSPST